jgi:hypothetical protein
MRFQELHLPGSQGAPLPFAKSLKAKGTIPNPAEAENRKPHCPAEPPDLAVAPFSQREVKPIPGSPKAQDGFGTRRPVVKDDTLAEASQRGGRDLPFHLDLIDPGNLIARMGQVVGHLAIVGQEQESLGQKVESAHRGEVTKLGRDEVKHKGTATKVHPRGHIARRLGEQDVSLGPTAREESAAHLNLVVVRIGQAPQSGDHLSIDPNLPSPDQALTPPPGGDPRFCQDLLKALLHRFQSPVPRRL